MPFPKSQAEIVCEISVGPIIARAAGVAAGLLRYFHVQQLQPVLERLQGEAAEDQAYAEDAEAALGEVIGVVLDHGDDRDDDSGQDAGQP